MKGKKDRLISCLMALILCLIGPIMVLVRAENENVEVSLIVDNKEEGDAFFEDSNLSVVNLEPGEERNIIAKNKDGEIIPIEEVKINGDENSDCILCEEGEWTIKAPQKDSKVNVILKDNEKEKNITKNYNILGKIHVKLSEKDKGTFRIEDNSGKVYSGSQGEID